MATLLVVAACGSRSASPTGPEIPAAPDGVSTTGTVSADRARHAVYTVRTTVCGTSNRQRAVAVAVGPTTVATVAHVFATTDTFTIESPGGAPVGAELAWLDPGRDLALLDLERPVDAWLEPGDAADGDEVTIVTVAEEAVTTARARVVRHVSATLDGEGERAALELAATVIRGQSGSPLVAADGRLVGLVFAASRGDERGWALAASEVTAALAGRDGIDPPALSC